MIYNKGDIILCKKEYKCYNMLGVNEIIFNKGIKYEIYNIYHITDMSDIVSLTNSFCTEDIYSFWIQIKGNRDISKIFYINKLIKYNYLFDFFYDQQELRKLKIKNINNKYEHKNL